MDSMLTSPGSAQTPVSGKTVICEGRRGSVSAEGVVST